ncbi:ABC transporter permease [Sodalis-like symbiont of Bactericera trigonica]|nr:ABC transporter permease [Sodalis-like symbiont of Bactericera trigonica]
MLLGGQVSSGLLLGLLAVLLVHGMINHTALGLRMRVLGANPHAARHAGLPVGALTLAVFALSAGLAGTVEIMAIEGNVRAD